MKVRISLAVREIIEEVTGEIISTPVDISYGFDWIDIAVSDPTRLSGMAKNLNFTAPPTKEEREAKGTLLKPGKFLRALFPDHEDIPGLAAKLQSYMTGGSSKIQDALLVSSTPSDVYLMYHSPHGSVGESCMRSQPAEFFEIYDDSPDIKILYLTDDTGTLRARALLHTNVRFVEDPDRKINLMDRIYVDDDNLVEVFKQWARKNGFYYKLEQNYTNLTGIVSPDGSNLTKHLYIDCPYSSYDKVPYVDTFRYYCSCEGVLYNTTEVCYEDTLENIDGTSLDSVLSEGEPEYDCHCGYCGEGIWEDDVIYTTEGGVCDSCRQEHYTFCDYCDEYVLDIDYIHNVIIDGEEAGICDDCLDSNYEQCEGCGEYVSGTVDLFRATMYGSSQQLCQNCIDEKEEEHDGLLYCSECAVYYPEDKEDCPNCKRYRFQRESEEKKSRAMFNRLKTSPQVVRSGSNYCVLLTDDGLVEFTLEPTRLLRKIQRVNETSWSRRWGYSQEFTNVWVCLTMVAEAKSRLRKPASFPAVFIGSAKEYLEQAA